MNTPDQRIVGEPVYCFTVDVDWASEDAIRHQQEIFESFDVVPTYFVTHHSDVVARLYAARRIERGIHPNFLPGSSHGGTIEEVVETVFQFAPDARCFRSHRYYDASPATEALARRGILYDSNLCTNLQPGISPISHESGLVRFPCFYEDGAHYTWQRSWEFARFRDEFSTSGIKIVSVHPMVTAMNVTSLSYWAEVKRRVPPGVWETLSAEALEELACPEVGPRRFLRDVLDFARARNFPIRTMSQLYDELGQPFVRTGRIL